MLCVMKRGIACVGLLLAGCLASGDDMAEMESSYTEWQCICLACAQDAGVNDCDSATGYVAPLQCIPQGRFVSECRFREWQSRACGPQCGNCACSTTGLSCEPESDLPVPIPPSRCTGAEP